MAYGIKYQFRLESTHGVEYTVNISKDGYSGDVISRPLGKAPILRKSVNGCIHSTTLDLVLECHVDGEYSEFYNAAPGEYFVSLFRNGSEIWQGSLVTELYSAPEIAPPYDVNVTANDGLALAKEFLYQPQGPITPLNLIKNLLSDIPGINRGIYIVSGIGATDTTTAGFWDTALINLDYMAGETKYDVLTYFLETIHATITQHDTDWLIARETDVTISSGAIPCLRAARTGGVFSSSITGASKSAGQMGVADLWPIGHMSTTVSPAKRRVTIEAPYHVMSGAPSVANNGWSIYDPSHATFLGGTYILTYATVDDDYGEVYAQIPIRSFTRDLRLSIKVSTYLAYVYTNKSDLKIYVTFTPTGGSPKYYNGLAWSTTAEVFQNPGLTKPVGTVETPEDFSFDISPLAEFADGTLDITFVGRRVQLYDAVLETIIGKGHKDTIIINNGARGDGDTVEIAGARVTSNDVVASSFLQGIFLHPDASPVEGFFDNNFSGPLSFMSLTAMGYALSVALPRLELTGLFNVPTTLSTVPLVVTYGGVNYWVESFDLNVLEEELTLTARSLPSATLSVESETITELPDEDARGGSSSGGGGGGGGGGSYTLPIASANTLGGVKVGTGLSIDSGTGVLTATGGGGGGVQSVSVQSLSSSSATVSRIAKITVDGTETYIYNDAAWGSENSTARTVPLTLNGTQKTLMTGLPPATISSLGGVIVGSGLSIDGDGVLFTTGGGGYILPVAQPNVLGGIKTGYTQTGKNYPVQLDSNDNAFVSVPWEGGGGGGGGTVTSVGMTVPTGFSVTGSPVTGSGTLAVSLDSQTKNKVLASPTSSSGIPSFRALDASDIPSLDAAKISAGTLDAARIPSLNASKIATGTLDAARIPNLDASKINAGTLDAARIPNLDASKINAGTLDAARIPSLDAAKITTGTLDSARIPNLDASKITSGTFDAARIPDLSGKYVTLDTAQTITGKKTFTGGVDANYIDLGDARLVWDSGTHSLHVTKRPGSSYAGDINIYADGDVGAGGPGSGSTIKYVNCANDAAYSNISPKDPATIYTVGTESSPSKIYLGTIQIH